MPETNFVTNIYFEESGDSQTGTPASPSQPSPVPEANEPTKPKGAARQLMNLATVKQLGSAIYGNLTSRVEMFTGSATLQAGVNDTLRGIGTAAAFFANPVLGSAMLAIDTITKVMDHSHNKRREQISLEEAQRRAGETYIRSRR